MQVLFLILFYGIPLVLIASLALPVGLRERSWAEGLSAGFKSTFGILIPLAVFLLSAALTPEYQSECPNQWWDCFHTGKLALTPFVFWSSAAYYSYAILPSKSPPRPWEHLGLYAGASVATVCFLVGIYTLPDPNSAWGDLTVFLAVPLYVSIMYWALCWRAHKDGGSIWVGITGGIAGAVSTIPGWALSVIHSQKLYDSLEAYPPKQSDCFIVTASQRGHASVVGPFAEIERRGHRRLANRQLITFWRFEEYWRFQSPRSHRLFRHVYNRIGPLLARRIDTPLKADFVYLLLRPLDMAVSMLLSKRSTHR